MSLRLSIPIFALISVLGVTFASAEHAPSDASAKLTASGIEPTVAGVSTFLSSQIPSDEAKREAETWIEELRSADFLGREKAERALLRTANPPVEALAAAAADKSDPETALRAARILKSVQTRPRTTLHLVLRWVENSPDRAFVPPLLALAEYSKTSVERSLIHRALAASTTADDVEPLIKGAANPMPAVRAAATAGLSSIPNQEAADAIATLTADPDESVRLAAATALADRGDRRCLVPLGKLLASGVTATRMRAHHLLGNITGEKFDFSAYAPAEDRAAATKKIQRWIETEGASTELVTGEKRPHDAPFVGRTVVANWPDTFQHYDADGTLLFSAPGFRYVWGCHGTADGQLAVVDAKNKTAKIYDAEGTEVWTKTDLPGEPSDIKILADGNRLITLSSPSKVIELDPEGNTVWKVEFPGRSRSTNAQRLPNGNTLVNLQFGKKVVEVNPEGEVVWELPGLKNCLTAQALPSGNILVCEMSEGKAIEYNREGKVVWEQGDFKNACQAQRLPNGNTLVSDSAGVHEIDPEGTEIGRLAVKRGRFWRY